MKKIIPRPRRMTRPKVLKFFADKRDFLIMQIVIDSLIYILYIIFTEEDL